MGLLDELKKQIAGTEDIAKLKTAQSLLGRRIKELEASEAPAEGVAGEAPAEEAVETPAEEMPEEVVEESPEEEPVEEPAPAPVKKPAPRPVPKAPPKPRYSVGMAVYGIPATVKFAAGDYKKGDQVAFEARIEKIEGDKAIIVYTDKDRSKALGNPPKRVRVALKALEPIPAEETTEEASDDDIPEESD